MSHRIRAYFFGFVWWKRRQVRRFFPEAEICFCRDLSEARRRGLSKGDRVYLWGKRDEAEIVHYAKKNEIPIYRVEDGFVRSVSLGSDLTKAYSLVVDSRGIYFDPTEASDLEEILNGYTFDETILQRAASLQKYIVGKRISKYNLYKDVALDLKGYREGQKVVMVPGQVEDDASILYGADGMSNLELLERSRQNAPDAYIIYKPHPDVLAGNRKGKVDESEALKYCDLVVKEASIDSVLERADEVHTMTSLVGFEALMRGKKVYTYGMPFYAGWGLTVDRKQNPRRVAKRSMEELIAAAYIVYPRYVHPKSGEFCEVEALLDELDKIREKYNSNLIYKVWVDSRNFVSRKIQQAIKVAAGE